MRHFLRPKEVQSRSSPISLLTFGVGVTAAQAVLIAATGCPDRAPARLSGTFGGAVALAAVAVAANQYRGAAAGAQVASSGKVHWSPWPMGNDGDARFVTYLACSVASSQLWARHRSWLGGWSRCRARVSTGRSDFYRISAADATPFADAPEHAPASHDLSRASFEADQSSPSPAALRLPDEGLRCNPSAGSPAGSKPHNRFSHA